jgi:hypothetical protein
MNLSGARKLELLLKKKKEAMDFTKSLACHGPAHNPAPAGSLVQIQPRNQPSANRGGLSRLRHSEQRRRILLRFIR